MRRIAKLLLVLTTLILLSFATPAANASTLIIGNSNDLSRYPFGRDPGNASSSFPDFVAGGTYQQVYASSAFSGTVTITQIAFASKGQLTSGPGTATYNFNLGLSTTAAGPNGLSTNLASNRGADFVQVFSGPFTATITANDQFDFVIDIAPFTYNPANGNLLLEVGFNSPMQFTGGQVLYYNAGFDSRTSRAANPSGSVGGAFTDGFGLETRFTTQATTDACTNTSTVINNNNAGAGSLRDAIAGTCPNGTVNFDVPGTGALNIVLTGGEIPINSGLTITAPLNRSITISGNNNSRVFNVTASNPSVVTISNLTIVNGDAGADAGGAIANAGTATLNLFNSTLSGNHAQLGGAIHNLGGIVNVTNSTLSGNTANNQGGGIYQSAGTINVLNSTLTANTATNEGGGIYQSGGGTINVTNSIVALNSAPVGPDLRNSITSQGHNIVGSITGAVITATSGDHLGLTAAQLKLGALANHGGTTRTHALLSGSPAIDAGDNTAAAGLATDQRGHARQVGSAVDIGAYEVGGVAGDFDRDLLSEIAVWTPATGEWLIVDSSTNLPRAPINWGSASLGDIPVPGDYDGDGETDIAVWRPSEGNWYTINSSNGILTTRAWGASDDKPVPADYDGDGKTDIAVYRPSEGNWYIVKSSDGALLLKNWGESDDRVVPGDYDGDGKADIAVWRPSEGNWYIINSSDGSITVKDWGTSGDVPAPGDYDGDGRNDIAVFRPSESNWYIINSETGTLTLRNWGTESDVLVPADYDGDGKTDIAVFRPGEGNWYIVQSSDSSVRTILLGASGDVPVPSAYIR